MNRDFRACTKALRQTLALLALALLPLGFSAAQAQAFTPWPDTRLVRAEALALLNGLNASLLSHASATAELEHWCADHHLAEDPRVRAEVDRSVARSATPEQRLRLAIGPDEPVAYRHVYLSCGGHVLSEADNFYVPSRLTAEMNRLLLETDTPFGRAVQGLGFHRMLLSAETLWAPLPPGWEMQQGDEPAAPQPQIMIIPDHVLRHRALLLTHDNLPFSEVVETYRKDLFDFPLAGPTR